MTKLCGKCGEAFETRFSGEAYCALHKRSAMDWRESRADCIYNNDGRDCRALKELYCRREPCNFFRKRAAC